MQVLVTLTERRFDNIKDRPSVVIIKPSPSQISKENKKYKTWKHSNKHDTKTSTQMF